MENKLIIEIGKVKSNSVSPHKVGFFVESYNSIDTVENYTNHNSEDIEDYADREDLETLMESLQVLINGLIQEFDNKKMVVHFGKQ